MNNHATTDKGDLGTLKVMANLLKQGYIVLQPISASSPFDLVIYKDNKFQKVQVKYREVYRGCIAVAPRRLHSTHKKEITSSNIDFDILAIYCETNETCYYVNRCEFTKSINLRVEKQKNNQSIGVRMAEDYLTIK